MANPVTGGRHNKVTGSAFRRGSGAKSEPFTTASSYEPVTLSRWQRPTGEGAPPCEPVTLCSQMLVIDRQCVEQAGRVTMAGIWRWPGESAGIGVS